MTAIYRNYKEFIPRQTWLAAFMTVVMSSTVGCGRPATKEECEKIFLKSVEFELEAQGIEDPEQRAAKTDEIQLARGDRIVEACEGTRITDRALGCVMAAKSADEVDACLE